MLLNGIKNGKKLVVPVINGPTSKWVPTYFIKKFSKYIQIKKNKNIERKKMWARKNKNRSVSGFFTKIACVEVINFIPVKVSTLYLVCVMIF
jgi:hypothetical protein